MLSIIVPFFNEEDNLRPFYKELVSVGDLSKDCEVIFIDDGSTDLSFELVSELAKEDKRIKLFSFRKNQGKSEALNLGFQKAKGQYIVTLDADLQDVPSEIPNLLKKLKEENKDIISGWRKNRLDKSHMVRISKIFNFIVSKLFNLELHDYNCGLKAYRKEAAKNLHLYGGLHRFIPLLAFQQGFSVGEIIVQHRRRERGKSKYGFSKLWKDLPDIFTMIFLNKYSNRPLHFFSMIGGLMLALGLISLIYLYIIHATGQTITARPLFFFGIILVLGGLQVFFTGFLADLFINISQRRNDDSFRDSLLRYSSEKNNE